MTFEHGVKNIEHYENTKTLMKLLLKLLNGIFKAFK